MPLSLPLMVVTRINAMHALLNLILLFLAIASIYFSLGAPFAAVLQIVVYAGAIIVLFVFVIMLLNLGREAQRQERGWLSASMWILPAALAAFTAGFACFCAGKGFGGPSGRGRRSQGGGHEPV